MKKIISWLLILALTAAVSIGATLAYLTDTDEDVNVMTLGNVKIDQLEYERVDDEAADEDALVQEFHDNKPLYPAVTENGFDYIPGDSYVDWEQIGKDNYTSDIWNPEKINNELDKMVFVKNKGASDAYVRTIFAFEAGKYTSLDEFKSMMHLNLNETNFTWEWIATPVTIGESTYFVATATYKDILAPGALTEISLSQIALDKTATNADVESFGDTYQILVKTQAIQVAGFEDPAVALDEGFGAVGANIPWDTDAPTVGATMKNALHYLEGDTTTPKITSKVVNVVFGLNSDYTDIVDQYDGTLVDVEQDVPVYAYYVPNGSNYDIYMLANDTIYAPASSKGLFANMGALKTVDTGNLDVSRVTDMTSMFDYCRALEMVDVSDWDTSNVTKATYMFYDCAKLTTLDVSDWDTSNLANMGFMFYGCTKLTALDVSDWNTANLTSLDRTFYNCNALTEFDASGWNTGKLTNTYATFAEMDKLAMVDLTGWDVSNVENSYGMFMNNANLKEVKGSGDLTFTSATKVGAMFQNCKSLTYLDVTNWDFGQAQDLMNLFRNCNALEEVEGSGNWNCGSATSMEVAFLNCFNLKTLDVSNWDVSNVKSFNRFVGSENQNAGDMALEQIIGLEKWNPAKCEDLGAMFYGCGQLTEISIKNWNLPNLTSTSHMFADCYNLESIDLTGWNTPALTNMSGMFNHCKKLKEIDLSSFNTGNVTVFAQIFEHCYALERIYGLENWDTSKGDDFSEMFSNCYALKELNLSAFDTRNAYTNKESLPGEANWVFLRFMDACTGLEKITFGANFDFDGVGNCPDGYKFVMPSASAVEGWDGNWYDAQGNAYAPADIPEKIAATYYAVKPVTP